MGNRFHIYFLSSGCLYHYHNALIAFFTDVFLPQNSVHSCILNALQIRDIHVTTRAFGIMGKLTTGPWMRLLGVETNILGMNKHFQEALDNITTWRLDASSLIQPDAPCAFSSVEVKRHCISQSSRAHRLQQQNHLSPESSVQGLCRGDGTATAVATSWRGILESIRSASQRQNRVQAQTSAASAALPLQIRGYSVPEMRPLATSRPKPCFEGIKQASG